jgi:hypothetical protein
VKTPLLLALLLALTPCARAQTSTISATQRHAWSANTGWIDFRPQQPSPGDGFRLGDSACAGWIWSANAGWIHCGDGSPANLVSYANTNATDFGVNHSGTGNLSGYAWAPNLGWINFGWAASTNVNRPRVDLGTGTFTGFVWSANAGWINLAGSTLRSTNLVVADSDGDGIGDAYEIQYAGSLTPMNASSHSDADGVSDLNEYLAFTHPRDAGSFLKVTGLQLVNPNGSAVQLTWTSSPARRYKIERNANLTTSPGWQVSPFDPATFSPDDGAVTTRTTLAGAATRQYFRVRAVLPLQP